MDRIGTRADISPRILVRGRRRGAEKRAVSVEIDFADGGRRTDGVDDEVDAGRRIERCYGGRREYDQGITVTNDRRGHRIECLVAANGRDAQRIGPGIKRNRGGVGVGGQRREPRTAPVVDQHRSVRITIERPTDDGAAAIYHRAASWAQEN